MPQISYPDKFFVDSDIKTMALSLIDQACAVRDEEPLASLRRFYLMRASSHLLRAYAELEELQAGIRENK